MPNEPKKSFITPPMMLSYPWLHEAQPGMENEQADGTTTKGPDKFSAVLVAVPALLEKYPKFGKSYDVLKAAAKGAGEGKFGDKWAAMAKNPNIKTGFRYDVEGKYDGAEFFINAGNTRRPGFVYLYADTDGKPKVVAQGDVREVFYPGAIVRASLNPYGYDRKVNRGVAWGLNHLQLIDGKAPRLDNRTEAQDDFEADASVSPASLEDLDAE